MESFELDRLLAGKEAGRNPLARLPMEEKPILRQRGRRVRSWLTDVPLVLPIL